MLEHIVNLANKGDSESLYKLSMIYFTGNGVQRDINKAIELCMVSAKQGYVLAQFKLGVFYEDGIGLPKDEKEALKWYGLAADHGYYEAKINMDRIYHERKREALLKAEREAFEKFLTESNKGNSIAQLNLGIAYQKGIGTGIDAIKAEKWIRLSAMQGNFEAQYELGSMYRTNEIFPNNDIENDIEAEKWFLLSAKQGYAKAQFALGWMYANDEGCPKDSMQAEKWFKLSADQGDADAHFTLGILYYHGYGVKRNRVEAYRRFQIAAELGDPEAQFTFGVIYNNGDGFPKDKIKAIRCFHLAAKQGHPIAQFNLGWIYMNGDGVQKNYKESAKWLKLAAIQGNDFEIKISLSEARFYLPVAQFHIGMMYYEGKGGHRDREEAYKWFRLAADYEDDIYFETTYVPDADFLDVHLSMLYSGGRGIPDDAIKTINKCILEAKHLLNYRYSLY